MNKKVEDKTVNKGNKKHDPSINKIEESISISMPTNVNSDRTASKSPNK